MLSHAKRFVSDSKTRKRYFNFMLDELSYKLGLHNSYFPCDIGVFVNSICNSNCIMCDIGLKNKNSHFYRLYKRNADLDLNKFKEFIDEVKQFKPSIGFMGTEPLLYPHIIEAIKLVKDANLACSMVTNGFLLPKFADRICDAKLDSLSVSVDGTYETHNKIRRVPHMFENIIEGLDIILKRKERPFVGVWTTILPLNYEKLYEIYDFFNKMGVDSHLFAHMSWIDKAMCKKHNRMFGKNYPSTELHASVLNPKDMDIAVLKENIDRIKDYVKVSPEIYDYKTLEKYYHSSDMIAGMDICKVPYFSILLAADGTLLPHTRCYDIELGNIYEESFKKIWNGKKMRQFRKDLLKHKAFPSCARCCGLWSGISNAIK